MFRINVRAGKVTQRDLCGDLLHVKISDGVESLRAFPVAELRADRYSVSALSLQYRARHGDMRKRVIRRRGKYAPARHVYPLRVCGQGVEIIPVYAADLV